MIIPYGTDRSLKRPTKITFGLVGLNVLVFLVGAVWGSARADPQGWEQIYRSLWLDPSEPHLWSLVTYQFLHAGLLHLLGNMLFLWVFGPNVEDRLGRLGFLAFYLVGGAIAGGAHWIFEGQQIPGTNQIVAPAVVGASGSIAAVTGAYLVLFPKTLIRVFVIFFIIGVFQIPAAWIIGFAIFKDLFYQGLGASQGVALVAHLGGYAFGIGISLTLLATGLLKREPYDLFSLGRQAHRRRVFRELTTRGHAPWSNEIPQESKIGRPVRPGSDESASKLADRRAEITRAMAGGNLEKAAELYVRLVDETGSANLPRSSQYDLANHFFQTEQHDHAAVAYEAFLRSHPRDHEADRVRLLVALINARYLNDPIRAKALLDELRSARLDREQEQLARTLRQELG